MAQINSGASQVFEAGSASSQKIVGYASSKNWIARYAFTTDAAGASSVSWAVRLNSLAGGNQNAGLSWYIGTDPNNYANANAANGYVRTGAVAIASDGTGYLTFSGSADLVLLPNTTYYLWIYPTTTTYGYFYLTQNEVATVTTSGGAGLVYIYANGAWGAYQPYVYDGTAWKLCVPYVYGSDGWSTY